MIVEARAGIDSGLEGAIAIRREKDRQWLIRSMPTRTENGDTVIDCLELSNWMLAHCSPATTAVTMEDVRATVVAKLNRSAYKASFANAKQLVEFGAIKGALESRGFRVQMVIPTVWQNSAEKKNKSDKHESIIRSIQLHPDVQKLILKDNSKVTYDENKAESVLILHHQFVDEAKKEKRRGKK